MNSKEKVAKSISLTFRGFDLDLQEARSIIGVVASSCGKKGEPVKPNVKSILKRSFVQFLIEFPDGCRLDEMFPALMTYLGGVKHICLVRDQIQPDFIELDLVLPIKGSVEQEGGFLSLECINEISLLKASISFQFL